MLKGAKSLLLVAALAFVETAHAQDDPAAIQTKSGEVGVAQPGMGRIVFFRPKALMWAVMGCAVDEGDQHIARLGIGKYHVADVEPGKHAYSVGGKKGRLTLQVEAGKTYFIMCSITKGIIGKARLSRSDDDAFADDANGLTLSKQV